MSTDDKNRYEELRNAYRRAYTAEWKSQSHERPDRESSRLAGELEEFCTVTGRERAELDAFFREVDQEVASMTPA